MKRLVFSALSLAGIALAQDLPPDVLLLSRVKQHVNEQLHRLATVSCLEAIHRELQLPKGKMRPLDTIRLEVLTNGHKELYASPGDRRFSAKHPLSYAGGGTLGDGLFGLYLENIVTGAYVSDQYKGEEDLGGRRVARFGYSLPAMFAGQTITTPEGSGKVGLRGSFWVDPQTFDVVRLDLSADDFPPTLPVTEMTTRIDYAQTRLGNDLTVLLPQAADARLVKESGEISHNEVEFTHCRVFQAESTISFDAPDSAEAEPRFAASSVDDTLRPLPAGLEVTVKLRSRISGDLPVGTLIDGAVAEDVKAKDAVGIPAGSPVRGRLRRLERYPDPFSYFVVGLEFDEVRVQGIRYLFYADPVEIGPAAGVSLILSTRHPMTTQTNDLLFGAVGGQKTIENLRLYTLPGVAAFFFRGSKLSLPPDFRTVWKTLALKP
jgi:hypothetical protein